MTLFEYKKIFDSRHEFNESETDVIRERYPSVCISNIPVAWIVLIDEMLGKFRCSDLIKSVGQEYGQLIILFSREPEAKHKEIIEKVEQAIRDIDKDMEL